MKACFFVNKSVVPDPKLLRVIEFYNNDIRILEDLGFEVVIANNYRKIPRNCDLYFAWWTSSGFVALLKSKLFRKPCVIVAGGSDVSLKDRSQAGYNSRKWWQKFIIKWTLRHADAILAVSKDVYEDAVKLGAKKIHLVYNCVNTEKYKPVKTKKENIVLAISHLNKQNVKRKGIEDIIKSAPFVLKKHPTMRFIIIGNKFIDEKGNPNPESYYPNLLNLAKELGVEKGIEFAGKVSEKEKIEYYNKAKVLVSPSEHEGFGVAIAEALSCELPVVVTNRGAIPEVVGDSGLYIPLGDVNKIAEAINILLENEALRKRLGKRGRERMTNFNIDKRRERIREVLEKVMEKS